MCSSPETASPYRVALCIISKLALPYRVALCIISRLALPYRVALCSLCPKLASLGPPTVKCMSTPSGIKFYPARPKCCFGTTLPYFGPSLFGGVFVKTTQSVIRNNTPTLSVGFVGVQNPLIGTPMLENIDVLAYPAWARGKFCLDFTKQAAPPRREPRKRSPGPPWAQNGAL